MVTPVQSRIRFELARNSILELSENDRDFFDYMSQIFIGRMAESFEELSIEINSWFFDLNRAIAKNLEIGNPGLKIQVEVLGDYIRGRSYSSKMHLHKSLVGLRTAGEGSPDARTMHLLNAVIWILAETIVVELPGYDQIDV